MGLVQLIYASQPFGYDDALLSGILLDSRRWNAREGITGALICRADLYLQLLEGPEERVEAAYVRIARDSRHLDVTRLTAAAVSERLFPDWAMRDDPARSWIWSQAEVEAGAPKRADRDELLAIFTRLASEPA